MLSKDVLKKIKQIEIYTRRMISGALIGDSRSALKGSGLEFDQLREYQLGDDIRTIDWKSTSRMNTLLVKQYIEERDRTIMLAVDVSASAAFSSSQALKSEVMAEIAAVLAVVAEYGKDRVGLVLFSDTVELYIPPHKGRAHARLLMQRLFDFKPSGKKTMIKAVLSYIASLKERGMVVFLISDFADSGYDQTLRVVARKHDVIAVRCLDGCESALPAVGFITVEDSETGQECILDMRKSSAHNLNGFLNTRLQDQECLFRRCGIDMLPVVVDRPFMGDIIRFFRRRMAY